MSITFPVPHFPNYHSEAFDGAGQLYVALQMSGGNRSGCIVYRVVGSVPTEVLAPGSDAYGAPQLAVDDHGIGFLFAMNERTDLQAWPIPGWTPLVRSVPLALSSPWVSFGGVFAPPMLTRDGATVHMAGVVKGGTIGQTIGMLPVSWRPASQLDLAVETGGMVDGEDWKSREGRIDIETGGRIVQVSGGNRWCSLCVSWSAA
jgi:hypothetical protein